MPTNEDVLRIRDLDARAVRLSADLVGGLHPDQLGLPTPCAGWNLTELLAHMTVQHHGFATAARGQASAVEQWRPVAGQDPAGDYLRACAVVIEAFAEPAALTTDFILPEITRQSAFPAHQAMSFHLVDYVVHGWDVAATLGVDYLLDEELAAAALAVAELVPDGPARLGPGAAFAPALPAAGSSLSRTLALLGRDVAWRA